MPWLGWCVLVLVVLISGFSVAVKFGRRGLRKKMIAFLCEKHPEVEVVKECEHFLSVRLSDGVEGQMFLHNVYSELVKLKVDDLDGHRIVFEHCLSPMIEELRIANAPLSFMTHGSRLFPRIVNEATRKQLESLDTTAEKVLPSCTLEGTPLHVVYVLDSPGAVRYLTHHDLQELAVSISSLHDQTLQNLSKIFPQEMVRKVVEEQVTVSLKTLDTYDASRLLLVREYLNPGESLVALIPDRDTLTLCPWPANGDCSEFRKLAKIPFSDKLIFDGVLRVTASNIEVV